jgi:CRP-like cAMP-binding protein
MYFVASGAAEVLLSLAAQPVAVMGPGECFGEMVGTTHPNSISISHHLAISFCQLRT